MESSDIQNNIKKSSEDLTFSQWQRGVIVISATGIFIFSLFAVLYFARPIIAPVLIAVFLNLILSPLVRYLKRLGISYSISAALTTLLIVFLVGLSVSELAPSAVSWINQAPTAINKLERKVLFLKKPMDNLNSLSEKISAATELPSSEKKDVVVLKSNSILSFITLAGSSVFELVLAIAMAYFLLSSGDRFVTKAVELMPTLADKKKIVEVTRNIETSITNYLLSISLINLIFGIFIASAMWILGVPNPILWGAMACCLNFIPYIGSLIAFIIITLVSIASFQDPFKIILVPIVYSIIDWTEGSIITPYLVGKKLDINPFIITFWLLLWGWLWGAVGILIAIPMLVALKIIGDSVDNLSPISKFLTN